MERLPQVLLVDDERGIRVTLQRLLASAGFEVVAADSGEQALVAIRAGQRFDVILTDVADEPVAGHTNDLRVFPNPTNGMFTLETVTSTPGAVRIELVNNLGETVLTQNEVTNGGQFRATVTMGDLATGVYNVVMTVGNERWTVRLVRQ